MLILEVGCLGDLLIERMLFLGVCRVGDRGSIMIRFYTEENNSVDGKIKSLPRCGTNLTGP